MTPRPTRSSPHPVKNQRKGRRTGHTAPRPRRPEPPPPPPVVSAGALVWRPGPHGELEVLLVRSARWGDWSWPKGRIKPGETLPECAVREVAEETGVRPLLGVPLPPVGYVLPDGRDKTVSYWAATPGAGTVRTAGDEEIAEVAWLPAAQARERLTRPGDRPPLEALLAYAAAGHLRTRPLVVLRHAKARARAHWPGTEGDRPLTSVGRSQANALPRLLAVWAPEHLLTSPWARCVLTLRPYLRSRPDAEPEILPLLSEKGFRDDPARVTDLLRSALEAPADSGGRLICTHRPVLQGVMATLAPACTPAALDRLPAANPWLGTGEALVLHVAADARIVMVERFRALVRPNH